jgi:hypothetical protein
MKLNAKVKITDIKYENKVYLLGVEIEAEGFKFKKAYSIIPEKGPIDVKSFKENIRTDIIEEVRIRKAIAPIEELQKGEFNIEYGETKTDNNG